MEVAPASYTSAKSAVVIRVREAGLGANPEGEARLAKSTTIREGGPSARLSAPRHPPWAGITGAGEGTARALSVQDPAMAECDRNRFSEFPGQGSA